MDERLAEFGGTPQDVSRERVVAALNVRRRGRIRAGWWLAFVPLLLLGGLFLRSPVQEARPADAILVQLQELPASTLADAIDEVVGKRRIHELRHAPDRQHAADGGASQDRPLRPARGEHAGQSLGPRYGVQIIDESGPGDILVAATNDLNVTALGGLMATTAKFRGMAGVVVDGAVRDIDQIEGLRLAVFARSISPSTLVGRGTSLARDIPVLCGGVTVYPGDYIVGDRDGVVCIPAGQVQAVIRRSQEMEALEKEMMPMIREVKSLQKVIDKFKRI